MDKFLRFIGWTAGILFVIGLAARLLFLNGWTIPDDPVLSASMAPTLASGDVVLFLTRGTPGFGDLVRCPDPEDPTQFVVGRIAGEGGDVVDTSGRSVIVNNKTYTSESACAEPTFSIPHPTSGSETQMRCDVVNMGGGWHYRGMRADVVVASTTHKDVAPGTVYLLSDDRDFHDDSRDFGTVPKETCRQIFFRLWGKGGWGNEKARMTYIR